MDLNVKAPFLLTKELLPLLVDGARIIMIGSIAGAMPQSSLGTFVYDTSKAAVHHLTKVLAAELAPRRITVNAIAPGFVPTKMGAQIVNATGLRYDTNAYHIRVANNYEDDIICLL
jgi:NAD(P)-dependent dehydrogenase (short-subunit alcohol dehydrogenase family)